MANKMQFSRGWRIKKKEIYLIINKIGEKIHFFKPLNK